MNRHGLSFPVRESSVRPTISVASATSTPEMNTLRPVSSQPPVAGSRRAAVVIRCELEPASGSVMPKAIRSEPSAMPGSQRCFCASVPNRAITVPQMAGETTSSSSGQPAAPNSSSTMDSSARPPPPPPYSSGRFAPR
jgi:hypothetical protein